MAEEPLKTGAELTPDDAAGAGAWVQGFSPLPTGTRIGELTIQSVLGAGELGITYVTEHEKRNKRYALKEYFPRAIAYRDGPTVRTPAASAATFTWGLDRFLAEARALAKLRHPSIIAIHGVTEAGGTGYIGMAYEQGRDFGIWLHELRHVPSQEEIDKLLSPLLQGLEAAHAVGLFHSDIGPECIVVRDNGTPVLLDFGAFRAGMRRRLRTRPVAAHPYVAPEQLEPEAPGQVGPWTDIYAMSGLLYLAVTGAAPPSASDRAAGAEVQPVAAAAKGRYRSDFLTAIDHGLQLAPADRPQAMAAWRDALMRTQAAKLGTTRPAAKPAAAPIPPPAIHAPKMIVDDEGSDQARPETLMENRGFRALFYGAAGLLCGALAGALASIIVASLVRPECGGDQCVGPFLPVTTVVGALAGIWVGTTYARSSSKPAETMDL